MEEKELSAEQQLLGLIEKDNKSEDTQGPADESKKGQKDITKRKGPIPLPGFLKDKVAFIQGKIKAVLEYNDLENAINLANNTLVVSIYVIFIFLSFEMIKQPKKIARLPDFVSEKKEIKKSAGLEVLEDISSYLEKLNRRSIFKPMEKEEKKVVSERTQASSPLDTINQKLRLVGFSPSVNEGESYAMVEDLQKQTTFFIKEGEMVLGVKILKITGEKVILTDGNRNEEMR